MHTFIITSTLITNQSQYTFLERFEQTLNTIHSIRQKVPGAFIILIDNSPTILPSYCEVGLRSAVDLFENLREYENVCLPKSQGETRIIRYAFDMLKRIGLQEGRIFKISGRYKLSDTFNINDYDGAKNQYVFLARQFQGGSWCFPTRLWSFDSTIFEHAYDFYRRNEESLRITGQDIEHAAFNNIDFTKLVEFMKIHVEGNIAPTKEWICE